MAINPLQAPINYMAMAPQENLGQQFSEFGQVLAERQKRQQAQEVKLQFSNDLQTAQKDGTQQAWLGMIAKYPQFREAFGDVRKGMGEERLKNEFTQGFEISNAMEAKNFPAAIERTQNLIAAKKNSGEPTKIYEDVLSALERGDLAAAQSGANLSLAVLDPDRYEKSVKARTTAIKAPEEVRTAIASADKAVADATTAQATARNAEEKAAADAAKATADANAAKVKAQYAEQVEIAGLNKTNWDIQNLRSQISDRSARLNLDAQTTAATVAEKMASIQGKLNEIPADTRKLVNESAVAAATSKQSADQMNDLAKRLEAAGGGYGAFSNASELVKKGLGLQGGLTQLRQEYTRLRNTSAVKSLPPGAASDADIKLALQPFPSENADAKYMASFLRGMAKLQDIESAVANAKTDWLASNNGALTRAKDTFKAGDYVTKPGESFSDFTQRVTQDYSKRYNPATQTNLVNQIPTDRNPAPAAAANNIRSQADAILSGGR